MLKKNSMRFAAALIAALISFVVGPNAVLAAAPQRHDQVSMRARAPGLAGERWGGCQAASAAQAIRRKKSTSSWPRTSTPITSAA